MNEWISQIDKRLSELVKSQGSFYEPSLYSLSSGKRIRPLLTLAITHSFDLPIQFALDPACALEMIHTYSLIHDDLPCMDDDDLRRGKPSSHKMFGEAHAVLTGDFLLTYAFEVMSKCPYLSPNQKIKLIETLSSRAGAHGMAGGQMLDIESEGKILEPSLLEKMYFYKTACLLTAALEFGGIIASANPFEMKILTELGTHFGIAYQMIDDILDLTEKTLPDQPVRSDIRFQKATCLNSFDFDTLEKKLHSHMEATQKALSSFTHPIPYVHKLVEETFAKCHLSAVKHHIS